MAKRFSLNLTLPSSTPNVPTSLSPSYSPGRPQEPTSLVPAANVSQQAQRNEPELGLMYVQREDLHKQLRSLENLLQQLSSYQLLLSSLSKTEHKLAKASLELLSNTAKEGNNAGAGEVVANALTSSSTLFESLSEVTSKHAKLVSKEVSDLNGVLSKHFKKLSKLEKAHDAHVTACDAKIKTSGAKYEKVVKDAGKRGVFNSGGGGAVEVGQKHEKWIGTLRGLGEEIMLHKEQHHQTTSHLQTLALLSTAASVTSLASTQFTSSTEGVKKTAPTVGEVQRWRCLAEAGWIGNGGIDELELDSPVGARSRRPAEEGEEDWEELHPPRRMTADGAGESRRPESPVEPGTPTGSVPPNYSSYLNSPALGSSGRKATYFPPVTKQLDPPSAGGPTPTSPPGPSTTTQPYGEAQKQRLSTSSRGHSPQPEPDRLQAHERSLSPGSAKHEQNQQAQPSSSRPFYIRNQTSERTLVNPASAAAQPPPPPPPPPPQPQQTSTIRMVEASPRRPNLPLHSTSYQNPSSYRPPKMHSTASSSSASSSTTDLYPHSSPDTPAESWAGNHANTNAGLGLSAGSAATVKAKKTVRVSSGGVEVIGHSERELTEAGEPFEAVARRLGGAGEVFSWEESERREREQEIRDRGREREREMEMEREKENQREDALRWARKQEEERRVQREEERSQWERREREKERERKEAGDSRIRSLRDQFQNGGSQHQQEDSRRYSSPAVPTASRSYASPPPSDHTPGTANVTRRVSLLAQRFDSPAPSHPIQIHQPQPRAATPLTHGSRNSFSGFGSFSQEATRPLEIRQKSAAPAGGRPGPGTRGATFAGSSSVDGRGSAMADGGGFVMEEYEDEQQLQQSRGGGWR